jgi:hypothetical protein
MKFVGCAVPPTLVARCITGGRGNPAAFDADYAGFQQRRREKAREKEE